MLRTPLRFAISLALLGSGLAQGAEGDTRLLRFPDVSKAEIVFAYGGDLWIAGRDGGEARRLTALAGQELYPKFSPDGTQIAFSAEFAGTRQVYVMPAAGGPPRQLTWYSDVGPMPVRGGTDYRVLDWTPDGKHVVVRMNRLPYDERSGKPYLVPVDGGMETPMVIPESGGGMHSPDGKSFVYTPIDRDFRGWKRYRGGRAQDVWVYDLARNTSRQITDFRGTDHQPMWIGDTIYFVSDRDQTLNLYSTTPTGGEAKELTQFRDFDILWPSAGPDAIVYENGGQVWRYDVGSGRNQRVPITVRADLAETQPRWVKVAANIESFDLAPHGERAVFGARGEVFTVPAKNGEPRNLSHTPTAREIAVSWSPDGRQIAYLSDASGEYEIYVRNQDGTGEPRRVTTDGDVWRFNPLWSPNGKYLAYGDKSQRVRIVEVANGATTEVDRSNQNDITDYTWSPDSRWLAYSKTGESNQPAIWAYSLERKRAMALTDGSTQDTNPAFDPKGRYLYFLSNRDYNLTNSAYEANYLYTDATRIYAAPLRPDAPSLDPLKSDEVAVGDGGGKKDAKAEGGESPVKIEIDAASFARHVVALKAPAANYQALSATADAVFFLAPPAGGGPAALKRYGLEDGKAEDVIGKGVTGYALGADGKNVLVRRGDEFAVMEAKADRDFDKSKLSFEHLELRIDPRVEWQQQYVDAWRIVRDWEYDPGVHGGIARWNAIRDRYQALIPHLSQRADLDYVFHEIAGEANSGHVYVQGAPGGGVKREPGGMLGAELVADASGYFRIAKIYPGQNWDGATRSPLTEAGVDVAEGSYLIAVDGVDARSVKNVYALFERKGERVVELKVNGRPSAEGARTVRVKTLDDERSLRYLDWVATKRAMVDKLSGGRIGYIHVPNTAVEGNRELAKGYAAYAHKDALIIDDRYNGGGFIPDRMIELVARKPLNYWKRRGIEPQATPLLSHRGPKAMLVNGLSSSGGDAFPYYFKKLKLGPVIGTRTWGGLIGISGNPPLADNGTILASTFRFMDTDNRWAVENEGVSPDVEVVDRPELIAAGKDPSIEKAVEMLLEDLRRNPPGRIEAPPAPTEFK